MFESIRKLIINNLTIEAIDEIASIAQYISNKSLFNDLLLQKSRLNKIERDNDKGLVDKENYRIEILKINQMLVNVLSEIENCILQTDNIETPVSNLKSKNFNINEHPYDIVIEEVRKKMNEPSKDRYRTIITSKANEDTVENIEKSMTTTAFTVAANCLDISGNFPYFDIIWFIDAKSDNTIYDDLFSLAQKLDFPISKNKLYFLNDLKKFIESIDNTWLLIYLNVCDSDSQNWSTIEFESKYFPATNLQKQIVFTSNNWYFLKEKENLKISNSEKIKPIELKKEVLNDEILNKGYNPNPLKILWDGYFSRLYFILVIIVGILFFYFVIRPVKLSEKIETKLPLIKTITQLIYDDNNNGALIEIDILSKDFIWVKSETISAEYRYDGKRKNLSDYFAEYQGYKERINASIDIICFGNSSFEEDSLLRNNEGLIREETRAIARSENLGLIIKGILTNENTTIYTLNLGKNMNKLSPNTNSDFQRTIVIVRVLKKNININLGHALHKALLKNKEMPFNVSEYSRIVSNDFDIKMYAKPIRYSD